METKSILRWHWNLTDAVLLACMGVARAAEEVARAAASTAYVIAAWATSDARSSYELARRAWEEQIATARKTATDALEQRNDAETIVKSQEIAIKQFAKRIEELTRERDAAKEEL